MSLLETIIKKHIVKNGPITVAEYMELALQHSVHGYYRSGDVLGRGGDFITAPEVSQMFGEMIGLWCTDVWHKMGKPADFTLLEMGPGRATLMQDALRATAKISGFHDGLKLHFLESNDTFRAMQKKKLGLYKPVWIDDLTHLPKRPIIVIANEFFDALPIRQFEKTFSGWCEKKVIVQNEELEWTLRAVDVGERTIIPSSIEEAKVGIIYEVSLPSILITELLARHMAEYGGAMLVIDYGFTERSGASTLQALRKHAYANVLENPGQQDITAHVDFGAMKHAARDMNSSDIITQGDFLRNLGIEFRAAMLHKNANAEQLTTINTALHRLTHVDEMGSLFKVLAITSRHIQTLAGF
jgi:NADH dehydrogenase [ubiquinone] 1 alpha subcomplex assembly factor 7